MNNNNISFKIALFILIFISIIVVLGLIFYFNLSKQKTIVATVEYKTKNYMIVKDNNNQEYKIDAIDDIEENDILEINLYNINSKSNPITAKSKYINKISKDINFVVEDNNNSNINSQDTSTYKNDVTNNEDTTISKTDNQSNNLDNNSKTDINTYIEEVKNQIDNNNTSKLKENFVKIIDFIFYDGEINGKKFSELSADVKLKVLSVALYVDKKIDEKFPNYKEEVSSSANRVYTDLKIKIVEKYLNITTDLCSSNSDSCDSAKAGFSDLKSSFSLTWDNIKALAKDNLTKLKNWYEIWRKS